MMLLINPREAPRGYRHGDGYSAVRVLYSEREASRPSIKTKKTHSNWPSDLYDSIWPWSDMGAAQRHIFINGQYRMNLGLARMPQEVKVGDKTWISVIGGPGGEQAGWMDGEYSVVAIDDRCMEIAP